LFEIQHLLSDSAVINLRNKNCFEKGWSERWGKF